MRVVILLHKVDANKVWSLLRKVLVSSFLLNLHLEISVNKWCLRLFIILQSTLESLREDLLCKSKVIISFTSACSYWSGSYWGHTQNKYDQSTVRLSIFLSIWEGNSFFSLAYNIFLNFSPSCSSFQVLRLHFTFVVRFLSLLHFFTAFGYFMFISCAW